MIIRIMGDNQYRVADTNHAAIKRIEQLDDELVQAVEAGDDARFEQLLAEVIERVHQEGQVVPAGELVASELMVPAADMTLAEVRALLHRVAAN